MKRKPKAAFPRIRSDDFAQFYSNASRGALTPWDIEITFSRMALLNGDDIVEDLAAISFSPQHAKAVLQVLSTTVNSWEERYGEIVLSGSQLVSAR